MNKLSGILLAAFIFFSANYATVQPLSDRALLARALQVFKDEPPEQMVVYDRQDALLSLKKTAHLLGYPGLVDGIASALRELEQRDTFGQTMLRLGAALLGIDGQTGRVKPRACLQIAALFLGMKFLQMRHSPYTARSNYIFYAVALGAVWASALLVGTQEQKKIAHFIAHYHEWAEHDLMPLTSAEDEQCLRQGDTATARKTLFQVRQMAGNEELTHLAVLLDQARIERGESASNKQKIMRILAWLVGVDRQTGKIMPRGAIIITMLTAVLMLNELRCRAGVRCASPVSEQKMYQGMTGVYATQMAMLALLTSLSVRLIGTQVSEQAQFVLSTSREVVEK